MRDSSSTNETSGICVQLLPNKEVIRGQMSEDKEEKIQIILSQCGKCGERYVVKVIGQQEGHDCPPASRLDSNGKSC